MEGFSADDDIQKNSGMEQAARDRKLCVMAVLPSMLPSAAIYILRPLGNLADKGHIEFSYVLEDNVSMSQIRNTDVFVFCRNQESKFNYILEEARMQGSAVLYDLDDNFWEIPFVRDTGLHRLPYRMHQLEHYLRNVDKVRTYNPVLREYIQRFSSRIHMAISGIDFSLVPQEPLQRRDHLIRVTYVTGRGNRDPLNKLFVNDLAEVLEMYPDRVEGVVWRECPPALEKYPNVRVVPIESDYGKFLSALARSGYDIGLAPMLTDNFHLSKTNTKFRDYGACRIAGIYSKVSIYTDCIEPDRTGILVDQVPGAWRNAMGRLVEDDRLRTEIQEAAYQYVYDHYRQEIMEEDWLQLLRSLRVTRQQVRTAPSIHSFPQETTVEDAPQAHTRLAIGRDTYPLPGFQNLITGLNRPFPMPDNTFRLVYLDSLLAEVDDLLFTMHEVYRVCQHGAQICLFVPYEGFQSHQANPKRKHSFNEHTPRYWTCAAETGVYELIYASQENEPWGLLDRLDSDLKLDLRCQKITFFYTPAYRHLTEEEKRIARQTKKNVCDYIMYHLVVIKQPIQSEEEMHALDQQSDDFTPPEVIVRQYQELVSSHQEEVEKLQEELILNYHEMEKIKGALAAKSKELQDALGKLALYQQKTNELLMKLESFRQNKAYKLLRPLLNRSNAWLMLPATFEGMKTDARTMYGSESKFILRPGSNISNVSFVEYPVAFSRPNLTEIHLAVALDIPLSKGGLGIELVSPQQKIVFQQIVPSESISEQKPVVFQFTPVAETGEGEFRLRVFARETDAPLRLFELVQSRLFTFGRARTLPFIGLRFLEN